MTQARSAILVLGALWLIPTAAKSAAADKPAGATVSSTAATIATPSSEAMAKARPWSIAEKPRYERGGWWCSPGLVWRNAGPRDWLCVDPNEARRVDQENEAAAENWVDGPDGPYTCRSGLV